MGDQADDRRVPPRRSPTDWGADGERFLADVLARLGRMGPLTLERQALRVRSYEMRHLLVARATGGALGYDALAAHLRGQQVGSRERATGLPHLVPDWTYSLARVIGLQRLEPDDELVAARLLAALWQQAGVTAFDGDSQYYFAQLLVATGALDQLRRIRKDLTGLTAAQRMHLSADLADPAGPGGGGNAEWSAAVAELFGAAGVETVGLLPAGPSLFDRLTCAVPPATVSGPLVSVILTCFRPGPELEVSVRSILDQTWAHLELVIVDDASGPEFDAILARCADLDPRVRIVKQAANGGTYLGRNAGLDEARGEFVTGQDDDDWSHPRRIERQIAPLLADTALRGTRSQCFRVSPDLRFTRPGQEPTSANGSSLLFRREQALATAGYFDSVRKGADTEYLSRLTQGQPETVLDLETPLAFVRVTDTTLSSGEFAVGWMAESRRDYRLQYRHWHERNLPEPLPRDPRIRAFPAPAAFRRGIPGAAAVRQHYDVVVLGEWQSSGGPSTALLDEVRAVAAAGFRVGVAHVEPVGPTPRSGRATLPELLDLAAAGGIDLVQLDSGVEVGLLLVRELAACAFLPTVPTNLAVHCAVLVADEPPTGQAGLNYVAGACEQAIQDRFGVTPTWIPVDARVRAGLASVVDTGRLESHDLGWAVDPGRAVLPRPARRAGRPVLGWNPDLTGAWPADRKAILAAYPPDDEFDVRIRGGADALLRTVGRIPPLWVVFRPDEIAPQPFLRGLDFYVHATESLTAATTRSVLEAVALGALAVVPPALEPTFGPIAEYAAGDEVRATVRNWAADPVALAARISAAKVALLDRFGPPAYLAAVRKLLAPVRT